MPEYPRWKTVDLSRGDGIERMERVKIEGSNFDPDVPHPPVTTIGKCNTCARFYLLTTEFKWTSSPEDSPVLGFWNETRRDLTPFTGTDISQYKKFMTTLSCPDRTCKGSVDGGNF